MRRKTCLTFFILIFLLLTGCSSNSAIKESNGDGTEKKEQVNFKVVSFLDTGHPFTKDIVPMWMKKMEEATGGTVTFEWIGGPESIPIEEQFDAVRNGIADVGFNTSSYYGHLMPETLSLHLSPNTPDKERENGYFDYLSKRFESQGLMYLGRWLGPSPFYLWSNTKIEGIEDFKGLNFRSNPTYHEILQGLGAKPVTVTPSDVYTSLERNMVDGFGFPLLGPNSSGWTEVTKYIIDEPFLNQNATILINQAAFNKLSKETQKQMLSATAEFEKDMYEYFNQKNEEEWKTIQSAGVEKIKFNSEDSKKFQKVVEDVYWKMLEEKAPSEVKTLKELLTK